MTIVRMLLGSKAGPVTLDWRLVETDYGRWEGLIAAEIAARDGPLFSAHLDDPLAVAPPDGESYEAVFTRVEAAIRDLQRPTVIVCHAGVAAAIRAFVLDLDARAAKRLPVTHGAVYRIFDGRVEEI